ncbi:MAG: DUF4440 domain-containing protein [Pirellulaceae bacterium]
MNAGTNESLLRLNQQLLDAIDTGDWETYQRLCDPSLSAFEPEALGCLVEGMDFHKTYFANRPLAGSRKSTMQSSQVRLTNQSAVVTYIRLIQAISADGQHSSHAYEETRVWHQVEDDWKHVHFHRSKVGHLSLG